jgi:ABC-type dipeptide/oligopeptide/nickel transport system permease subunit
MGLFESCITILTVFVFMLLGVIIGYTVGYDRAKLDVMNKKSYDMANPTNEL